MRWRAWCRAMISATDSPRSAVTLAALAEHVDRAAIEINQHRSAGQRRAQARGAGRRHRGRIASTARSAPAMRSCTTGVPSTVSRIETSSGSARAVSPVREKGAERLVVEEQPMRDRAGVGPAHRQLKRRARIVEVRDVVRQQGGDWSRRLKRRDQRLAAARRRTARPSSPRTAGSRPPRPAWSRRRPAPSPASRPARRWDPPARATMPRGRPRRLESTAGRRTASDRRCRFPSGSASLSIRLPPIATRIAAPVIARASVDASRTANAASGAG